MKKLFCIYFLLFCGANLFSEDMYNIQDIKNHLLMIEKKVLSQTTFKKEDIYDLTINNINYNLTGSDSIKKEIIYNNSLNDLLLNLEKLFYIKTKLKKIKVFFYDILTLEIEKIEDDSLAIFWGDPSINLIRLGNSNCNDKFTITTDSCFIFLEGTIERKSENIGLVRLQLEQ